MKALIVWGGWDGHEPKQVADIFTRILEAEGFEVEVSDKLEAYADKDKLLALDLIVPVWTMGELSSELTQNVLAAVQQGTGIAGCHGGMGDSFRTNVDWQFMVGGQWVAHPGNDGVEYTVNIVNRETDGEALLAGLKDFKVKSEQYYMHVDPVVQVHATTRFPVVPGPHDTNPPVDMLVVWTKMWGQGRVFYNSLGHHADIVDMPEVTEMMRRGFLWAAAGKQLAAAEGDRTNKSVYSGMQDSQYE
ncbi:hypothetical protein AWM70_06970 [Paenibacillus yonginensis]|uniref:ThuA-like domain-containing protein n=1 Tax=Paenibacillus yonginensis TaxID=1462996 RepID=A0A1B1MYV8_9BACL|nr:ThuA domain-containing protein [Paenibacillus yonginensis]ANS74355.1 hypothetical protein AWM70_06970 [Paenibacillus yonginensis]